MRTRSTRASRSPTPPVTPARHADLHKTRVTSLSAASASFVPGGFVDPSLPSGYAPFGIQTIVDRVFVTYAKQDADAEDEVAGQSLGFVDVFSTAGDLLGRVAQHGQLNAPWGLALAPSSFGRFAGDLLVGNFGDGQINAYEELPNGHFAHRGELRSADGGSISIDGLWALQFGKAGNNGPAGTLFLHEATDDRPLSFGSITWLRDWQARSFRPAPPLREMAPARDRPRAPRDPRGRRLDAVAPPGLGRPPSGCGSPVPNPRRPGLSRS